MNCGGMRMFINNMDVFFITGCSSLQDKPGKKDQSLVEIELTCAEKHL